MSQTHSGWGVTEAQGTGNRYQHYFDFEAQQSLCGRTDRKHLLAPVGHEADAGDDVSLCNVCRRKYAIRQRREQAKTAPVLLANASADERMSIADGVALINSYLGEDFITPNAMHNRIWRVRHAGGDPACAPAFASVATKAFFTRESVLEWVRKQVRASVGLDLSRLPPELAADLAASL